LYKKFKLKVRKAREMGLADKPAFAKELNTYRRQLSSTYLTDKEVSAKLVSEAYERSKEDVEIQHIMIKIVNNDAEKALQKINAIQQELEGGADFTELARKKSQHASRKSGGKLGYITVLQLPDLYNFESAAYNTLLIRVTDKMTDEEKTAAETKIRELHKQLKAGYQYV